MAVMLELIKGRFSPPADTKPSFSGKTVLITGANTGLGYEASLKLVQLGASRLIIGVRSRKKGEDARARIETATGRKGVIEVWELDMLSYDSVKAFAGRANKELDQLDYAILNAGVVMATHQLSTYGWEKTLQVNVLSTAFLALVLLPKLRASKTKDFTPVLELVSSGNSYIITSLSGDGKGPLATYNDSKHFGALGGQYNVSKVFLEYFKVGLVHLIKTQDAAGMKSEESAPVVYVVSVCPGATKSDLGRDHTAWHIRAALWVFKTVLMRSTEQGSRTYISGLTLKDQGHGGFWRDDVVREPAPLLQGEKGAELQAQVWDEVVAALKKDVPEVANLV